MGNRTVERGGGEKHHLAFPPPPWNQIHGHYTHGVTGRPQREIEASVYYFVHLVVSAIFLQAWILRKPILRKAVIYNN